MSETLEAQIDQIQNLINRGRFFESAQMAKKLAKENPMNARLRQLAALAMSKSGTPKLAADFLEPFYGLNPDDPETAGILGGIYKSIFRKNQDPHFGNLSFETYLKNYESTGNYYTGINAASMSTLIGMAGKGRRIATELVNILNEEDFWELATLAEAKLLLKDSDAALDLYIKTRKMAGTDWGKVNSIQAQLWLLNHMIRVPQAIMKLFEPPKIAAFVGHMIDHPNRKSPRFTPDMENDVKEAIRSSIKSLGISIGYCSLACGSDILFAETMLEENKELTLIVPFGTHDFKRTSIDFANADWGARFDKILADRKVSFLTKGGYKNNDEYFSFVGKVIMGSAIVRAKMNSTEPMLLSVLSNFDLENKIGGTRDMISIWPFKENQHNINIDIYNNATPIITHSEPGPSNKAEIEDSISNILICKFSDSSILNPDDDSGLLSALMDFRDDMIVAPVFYSLVDQVIAILHSPIQVMEIVTLIRNKTKGAGEYHLGLHAGPVALHKNTVDGLGDHFKIAHDLMKSSPPGSLMATKSFASVLALESRAYRYDHTGFMDSSDGLEIEVFRIEEDKG